MKRLVLILSAVILQFSSCSKQDVIDKLQDVSTSPVSPITPEGLNAVALTVANMGITTDMIADVHKAIATSVENGSDEHISLAEVVSESSRVASFRSNEGIALFAKAFRQNFPVNEKQFQLRSLLVPGQEFDLQDFLNKENATLYWPYADEWDGVTTPTVVVSTDRDTDEICVGYKLREEKGKYILSEQILVDENFALKNPVWVINREGQKVSSRTASSHLRSTKPVGSKITTLQLGMLQPTKHHDAWHKGGDEYVLQLKAPKHTLVNGKIEIVDQQYVRLKENFTRKEISRRVVRKLNHVIVSEWQPELNEIAVHLYENDASLIAGMEKTYKLKATWGGKEYGLEVSLPFASGDDELYRGVWSFNFIFSTGNYNRKDNSWVKHSANGLYYTLPFVTNEVIYDPENPIGFDNLEGLFNF